MSTPAVRFYDQHPAPSNFLREVTQGLAHTPRAIPPKFFYDEEGSRLFDRICETPEYYLTRTEHAILRERAGEIGERIGPDCVLIEPGSGSCEKVRLLLDAVRPSAYVPVDISGDYLRLAAETVCRDYPWLDVHAACADFTRPLTLPIRSDGRRRVAFFPGSSIGNFEPSQAVEFLGHLAAVVGPGGGLLIGVDLKKDPAILNAAYNDAEGVTAAFNLNLLTRINRELGADFDAAGFRHEAFYNAEQGRVEMHLISSRDQVVTVAGQQFEFAEGEGIHTECSYKYSVEEFQSVCVRAGFASSAVWTDPEALFSVHYLEATKGVKPPSLV